jgi:hypothetical protein
VHHAAAQHLYPARALAQPAAAAIALDTGDIHFCGGLGERKIGRPQAHRQIAFEERLDETMQYRLEVGEAHAFVHEQAFRLVEHRRVRGVGIHAIDATRRDDRQRQPVARRAQGADLHR